VSSVHDHPAWSGHEEIELIFANELSKAYTGERGSVRVLNAVSFEAAPGSVFTLLGPSGCGKTTTLRCIAGLEQPDAGEIRLGDRKVFSSREGIQLGAERRGLGMVFQSYAIWPHMTVGENVSYPLDGLKLGRAERDSRVQRALDLVGLAALVDRPAPNLSGGQQQRVALARALVAEPQILLLDEPLSNLDAKLRDQMRREIKRLQRRLGVTALFVTHDQEEALALSDTIALMNNGEVVEVGPPRQLYDAPMHRFTAGFLGLANFVPGTVVGEAGDGVVVETAFGRFAGKRRSGAAPAADLFFRPHKASLAADDRAGSLDVGTGTVAETIFLGETNDVLVERDGQRVRLRLPGRLPREGERLSFAVDPEFSLVFERSSAPPAA